MSLPTNTLNLNDRGQIIVTDDKPNPDGSVTISYSLNKKALEECASYYEKDIKQLTSDEIHLFVSKSIGNALYCHKGWKVVENVK